MDTGAGLRDTHQAAVGGCSVSSAVRVDATDADNGFTVFQLNRGVGSRRGSDEKGERGKEPEGEGGSLHSEGLAKG